MAIRKRKPGSRHTTLRMGTRTHDVVTQIADTTGWSASKAINYLCQVGYAALKGKTDVVKTAVQCWDAAKKGKLNRAANAEIQRNARAAERRATQLAA